MPFYLIQFAQSHDEFRLPEFESLAVLENVKYNYSKDSYRLDSPFFKVELESDEDARRIVKRSILVKRIYELWGEGATYDQVNTQVKSNQAKWADYHHTSFKFSVSAFGWTLTAKEQLAIINSFSYLGFEGDIDLVHPQVKFGVLEDYGQNAARAHEGSKAPALQHVYMGRLVASGSRDLVQKYNLKKRHYLGTTSMDAELSLVMANQALADAGKLVYDPFVGTGSFLFTCAHFGSFTLGSDIDGRQIRGKSKDRGVKSNIEQYNLQGRVLDSLVFDVTKNPWRCEEWLDAIVTAPYGVRAGAKKLGRKDEDKKPLQLRSYEGVPMHLREDYYPPTKPYEMSEVLSDLLEFSAKHLRTGGRLVYWLPTVVDEYSNTDVPQHPSMVLISNSEQNFGQWSRRLITMEKVKAYNAKDHTTLTAAPVATESSDSPKSMGHYLFREKSLSHDQGQKLIQQIKITCKSSWTLHQDSTGQRLRDWKITMVAVDNGEPVFGKLQAILDLVEYHLHPTFVDPIRGVKDEPYLLQERGWGEFDLHIMLHFKNDFAPEEQLVFKLDFKKSQYSVTYPLIFTNVNSSMAMFLKSPQSIPRPRTHSNIEPPASPISQRHVVEDMVVTGQGIGHLDSTHSRRHGAETCTAWDIPDGFDMVELARRLAELSESQVACLYEMIKKHQSNTMTISEENGKFITPALVACSCFSSKP